MTVDITGVRQFWYDDISFAFFNSGQYTIVKTGGAPDPAAIANTNNGVCLIETVTGISSVTMDTTPAGTWIPSKNPFMQCMFTIVDFNSSEQMRVEFGFRDSSSYNSFVYLDAYSQEASGTYRVLAKANAAGGTQTIDTGVSLPSGTTNLLMFRVDIFSGDIVKWSLWDNFVEQANGTVSSPFIPTVNLNMYCKADKLNSGSLKSVIHLDNWNANSEV